MKKHNPYALATLSLCISSIPVVAHSDDHAETIDEVIVTSSYVRSSQIEKHSLVIDGDSINQGATQSLGETLDDFVGISTSDYGAAVGHPIIRGMSGDRVKIMANGVPVRDVSGIGADHLNEVDLSNVQQIEIAKGPSSLMYASGTAGGIINIVDGAIAKSDITTSSLRISAETQTVNDGSSGSLSYSGNISGLNLTYSFKDERFGDYDIPSGAVVHSEDEHGDEGDHHDEEDTGFLPNTDLASRSHKLGLSKTGDWGHFGVSYSDIESTFGVPFHGDDHSEDGDDHGDDHDDDHGDDHDDDHGDDHDDDHGDDHDDDHGDDHDEHEGERIFSNTDSKTIDLDGSFNLNLGMLNKLSFTYRDSDYSHTEQHAEEEGEHGDEHDEHGDDHDDHGDDHDEHGDEHGHAGPTTFTNDSSELRVVFNLDTASFNQSLVLNLVDEDTAIVGDEAFMNPVDSSETSFGYYMSKNFDAFEFDFGARIDSVERNGSITMHHEDEDDHHDDEDHHDEGDHDEHEEAHEEEVTSHSYNTDMTSLAASISRDLSDSLTLSAGAAFVSRAPSSSELFMNGPHLATGRFEVGNPNLDNETHQNFDLALNYSANSYFASLTFFSNSVDNYIYLVDETEEAHEEHEDHDDHAGLIRADFLQNDADFSGYELEIGKTFELNSGSLTLAFARDSVIGELSDGSDVPRMVPARNIYSASYNGSTIGAELRFKDVEEQTQVATGGTATDGYQMLDFSMTKAFRMDGAPTLNVSIFGKNLLNEVARNHTSFVKNEVPLPGRNYGLKFNFEI